MADKSTEFKAQPKDVDNTNNTVLKEATTNVDYSDLIIPHTNRLLEYDTVTWKSKLFTMSTADYKKYQLGGKEYTELVISETGATGKYSIDEIVMTSVPPGAKVTKNSSMLRATITLSEQGSMTLFDELQAASLLLGYSKLMDVPLLLEVSFVGYDQYGEHLPVIVPGSTKLWRLHITDIKTRLDNSGGTTVYDIETTPLVYATLPTDWRLTEQIEMVATRDVKSFIAGFSQKLNAISNNQYGYLTYMFPNDLQPDNFYTFHVHPKIAELVLINDSNQDTANDKSPTGTGTKRFVFTAEQTIANVVDSIMDAAQSKGVRHDQGDIQKRQFVHVIPVSIYVGYDRFRKKHVYRYDIYIVPYSTLDYQDVDDTKNANNATDLKRLLDEAHPDTKYNMKKYEYLWSGLNTEVLSLDFNFNTAYAIFAAKNITSLYDRSNRNGVKSAEIKPQDQIASSEELQQLYLRKMELESNAYRTEAEENELIDNKIVLSGTATFEGESEQLIQPTSGNRAYLENVSKTVDLTSYTETHSGIAFNIEVPVDYTNIPEISSNTSDSNATQTEVAKRMIRSNYFNDSFLIKIQMQVVGDPYWLGKTEQNLIEELNSIMAGTAVTHDLTNLSMNTLTCEPCLMLTLHPAKGYDYRTGLIKEDPHSVFSQGIYRINSIVSTFSKGGFTQDLEASIITRSVNRGN